MDTVRRRYGRALDKNRADKEAALGELIRARISLGAALAANANAVLNGLPAVHDEQAIAGLTQDVLDGLRAVQEAGLDAALTTKDVLSFYVGDCDGHKISLYTGTGPAGCSERQFAAVADPSDV